MRNIAKTILILGALASASCSDYLTEDLQGIYSNATFYKTEDHAFLALTGIYNSVSFNSSDNDLWVFGDVASDDAIKGGQAGDQTDIQYIDDFSYARNNGFIEKIWKRYYDGISRANYLLYYGPNIDMDETLKARVLGEAKFLRAYLYFNLVNIFGEIPLKLSPPLTQADIYKHKSPVADIYAQIEKDLTEAVAVVDEKYTGADLGRVSKGAAWGMLAKVKLYQGKWQESLDAIAEVDKLGLYALQQVYKNNFIDSTQNNSESLFEIQHISGFALGSYLNQWFASPNPDGNGYFFDAPVQNFVNEFEVTPGDVTDPRLDYTVGRPGQPWINDDVFDATWSPSTGYLSKKHLQPLRENPVIGDGSLNYVYLRYADILLMKAEALNELDRAGEALIPLNAIRKRARESYLYDKGLAGYGAVPADLLPDVASPDKGTVRNAIRHERRVELGLEFHRYFDLMRYGQAPAEAALAGTGFDYSKRYFPVPQSEIDTNPEINK